MNLEKITQIAMEVITYSGVAKSCYMQAMQEYKQHSIDKGDKLFKEADKNALYAHKIHASLIAEEMREQVPQSSLMLIHAEDQLMNAETIRILVEEIKEIYNKGGSNCE